MISFSLPVCRPNHKTVFLHLFEKLASDHFCMNECENAHNFIKFIGGSFFNRVYKNLVNDITRISDHSRAEVLKLSSL